MTWEVRPGIIRRGVCVPPMLGGLQTNVQLVMSKHWLGMTIVGICELGGEGTREGAATLE